MKSLRVFLAAAAIAFVASISVAVDSPQAIEAVREPDYTLGVPVEIRQWFYNFTNPGSCVQCSIGMCGVSQNVPAATTLLWDTEYGAHEWHGSGPSRVAEYARRRGFRIYNVTGSGTYEWMKWAIKTGRPCAIGAATQHFQTLSDYDEQTQTWYVCNNNSPKRVDSYSDAAFHRLHESSGRWIVILDYPPAPARPRYVAWWE